VNPTPTSLLRTCIKKRTARDHANVMSVSTRTIRRARRVAGWAAFAMFLAVLTATFIVGPAECVSTVHANAAGVSTSGPSACPLSAVLPLVLLGVFVVAWIATVVWAAARRRSGVEPAATEVPMFPQGFCAAEYSGVFIRTRRQPVPHASRWGWARCGPGRRRTAGPARSSVTAPTSAGAHR
jgi:hypothetical protein